MALFKKKIVPPIPIKFFFLNGKQNRRNIVQIISIDNQVVITTKK